MTMPRSCVRLEVPSSRSVFANALLREFLVARAAADPAVVSSAAKPGGFAGFGYFRLHGSPRRYSSEYSDEFLNALASRLVGLAPTTRLWCIFDNTAAGFAIQNALGLKAKLRQAESSPSGSPDTIT